MVSVDDFLWFVDEALDGMVAIVTELGDDLANRRLDLPGANSAYAVLTHCFGVIEYWVGHVVAGRRIERDRDAEFLASGSVADLVERVSRTRRQLAADLAQLDPSAPPRGTTDPDDAGLPFVTTQGGAVFHVYEELAQHRGQMEVCRDVLLASWGVRQTRPTASPTSAVFLGTGNFLAPGRYWNSFVLDRSLLVEPSPTVLPHLRRCGLSVAALDVIAISHFHADHTFGWPFLLLEALQQGRDRPLFVVGPPGVEAFLASMMEVASVPGVQAAAYRSLDLRWVEVSGSWQRAGPLRFRAVEVEHVAHLRCFGYLFDRGGRMIGYSGDARPCSGLNELASTSDVLVLECNGPHPPPASHLEVADVRALRDRFPGVPFVLTHLGDGVEVSGIADVVVPEDFETVSL